MSESRRHAIGPRSSESDDFDGLPDEAGPEAIQYHIYVRQKVQQGLEAERDGKTLTHEEMKRRLVQWLEK